MLFDFHRPRFELREVEDVLDDAQKSGATVAERAGMVGLFVIQGRVDQQPAHPDDGVHRRADFVAHGGQKRALGLIGGFGFGFGFGFGGGAGVMNSCLFRMA